MTVALVIALAAVLAIGALLWHAVDVIRSNERSWALEREHLLNRIQAPERVLVPELQPLRNAGFDNDKAISEGVSDDGAAG